MDYLETDADVDARQHRHRGPLASGQGDAVGRRAGRAVRAGDLERLGLRRCGAEPPRVRRDGGRHQHAVPALVRGELQEVQRPRAGPAGRPARADRARRAAPRVRGERVRGPLGRSRAGSSWAHAGRSPCTVCLAGRASGCARCRPPTVLWATRSATTSAAARTTSPAYDWARYLDFADRHFRKARRIALTVCDAQAVQLVAHDGDALHAGLKPCHQHARGQALSTLLYSLRAGDGR